MAPVVRSTLIDCDGGPWVSRVTGAERSENWKNTVLGPRLTVADWEVIDDQLHPGRYDDSWERAITAIERRFAARFIEPADALLNLDASDRSVFPEGLGFAIV